MEERIFQALKAGIVDKEGRTNVSDRTLRAYAKRLSTNITEESQIADGIKEDITLLKEFSGNIAAEARTEAERIKSEMQTLLDEEKKKKGEPKIEKVELDEETKALLAELKASKDANELAKTASEKAAQRKAKIEATKALMTGAKNEYIIEQTLATIEFDESATPEQIAAIALPKYDESYRKAFGNGAVPFSPTSISPEEKTALRDKSQRLVDKYLKEAGIPVPEQNKN